MIMETSVISSPRKAVELFRMLPEGVLCEVIENTIYMSPAASFTHQKVIQKIVLQLDAFVEKNKLGEVVIAPFDVFLDEYNAFQPDILFIGRDNPGKIDLKGGFEGVPDFVVEILSPSNKQHDLQKKKVVYERCGVKEYWIVEPFTKEVIGYHLEKKSYKEFPKAKGKIKSVLFRKTFSF